MAEEKRKAGEAVKYLMDTVMSVLSEGLDKIADMQGNPVQNLGNYLLAVEAHKEKMASAKEQQNYWLSEVEKFKKNAPVSPAEEPETVLPSADNVVSLLMKAGEVIKLKCAASAVYFGVVRPNEDAEGDEDNEIILYEASTNPAQLERMLVKGQGVVWDVLVVDEEEEEEDPENPRPPKERKILHIPSLLVNGPYRDRVHFWDRPVTGAFVAMPLRYGSYLFSDALKAPLPTSWMKKSEEPKEKVSKESSSSSSSPSSKDSSSSSKSQDKEPPAEEAEPEEEAEVIPDPPTQPMTWLMCVDSTLTAQDFSEHIQWLRSQAIVLEEKLLEADKQEYLKHREAEEKLEAALATDELIAIQQKRFQMPSETNNLSHLVTIDKELLGKYHAIALAFELDGPSLVLTHNGKASWRKILAAFCTLETPLVVKDAVALRALVDEVVESAPSAIAKYLKIFSDSTARHLQPTEEAAEEEEVTEP